MSESSEGQADLFDFSAEARKSVDVSEDEFPCPWDECGRIFDTRRGVGIHHKQVHGESIGGPHVEVNCAHCGDPKMVYPGRAERSENHFCNKKCKGDYRKSLPKEEQHNWKGGKVEVTCEYCPKTKEVWPSRIEEREYFFCNDGCKGRWISENRKGTAHPRWVDRIEVPCDWCEEGSKLMTPAGAAVSERHFCSIECEADWRSETIVGEAHPTWDGGGVSVECAYCSEQKEVPRSIAERTTRNFCSPECNGKWWSENRSGRNHPAWKGGVSIYKTIRRSIGPLPWSTTRRAFRKIRSSSCITEGCDWKSSEEGREPHIHHIVPVLNGGTNHQEILIPLCPRCHTTTENYTRNSLSEVLPTVYTDYRRDELPEGRVPSEDFRRMCRGVKAGRELANTLRREVSLL